jgi:hypothetical protein
MGGVLSADEAQLVRVRAAATRLAVALVKEPFAAATLSALRAFAETAEDAHASFDALRSLPEETLRARIAELSRPTSEGEVQT